MERRTFIKLMGLVPAIGLLPSTEAKAKEITFNNHIKQDIKELLNNFLFEPNDKHTRKSIEDTLNAYLTKAKNDGIVYECFVVCDETNNTAKDIDMGLLTADVYIKDKPSYKEYRYIRYTLGE